MVESKSRKSFTLRLQPYEGTIIAEVVDYLNSLDNQEINQTIIHILIMTLLPLARQQSRKHSTEELRLTCLEACDALNKHASYLRQVLQVSQPQFDSVYLMLNNSVGAGSVNPTKVVESNQSSVVSPKPSSTRKEKTQESTNVEKVRTEIDDIFGDGTC